MRSFTKIFGGDLASGPYNMYTKFEVFIIDRNETTAILVSVCLYRGGFAKVKV